MSGAHWFIRPNHAAITDGATGRQPEIELAVRKWPSTGNSDWPLTTKWEDPALVDHWCRYMNNSATYLRVRHRTVRGAEVPVDSGIADARSRQWMRDNLDRATEHFGVVVTGEPLLGRRDWSVSGLSARATPAIGGGEYPDLAEPLDGARERSSHH